MTAAKCDFCFQATSSLLMRRRFPDVEQPTAPFYCDFASRPDPVFGALASKRLLCDLYRYEAKRAPNPECHRTLCHGVLSRNELRREQML